MSHTVKHSLGAYFNLLQSEISPHLISAPCWQQMAAVAQQLPSAITPFWGFECPLGTEAAEADLLICTTATDGGRQLLSGQGGVRWLDALRQYPIWQQIRRFSQEWNTETSVLYDQIHNIWLEFDVRTVSNPIASPSCFFAPQPIYATPQNAHPHSWITQNALPLLLDREVSAPIQHQVWRCIHALPSEAYMFQIGVMLSRQMDAVRLCIRNISPPQIVDYLSQLSWPGSLSDLHDRLILLSELVERIDLDIDVGETLLPKLGLECYLEQQPSVEPRWPLFLSYLVHTHLCHPQKQDALLNYPGHLRRSHHLERWPEELSQLSHLLGSRYETIFLKGLHHIKLTYHPQLPLSAKAYLAVGKTWVDKEAIKHLSQTIYET